MLLNDHTIYKLSFRRKFQVQDKYCHLIIQFLCFTFLLFTPFSFPYIFTFFSLPHIFSILPSIKQKDGQDNEKTQGLCFIFSTIFMFILSCFPLDIFSLSYKYIPILIFFLCISLCIRFFLSCLRRWRVYLQDALQFSDYVNFFVAVEKSLNI